MAKNAHVDTKALRQAIDSTIAQLKDEHNKGMVDVGRYSQLSLTFNTFKAEVEQLAKYEQEVAQQATEHSPAIAILVGKLHAQRIRVEKTRREMPYYGEFRLPLKERARNPQRWEFWVTVVTFYSQLAAQFWGSLRFYLSSRPI